MKIDEKGKRAVHDREGIRLKPYFDTRGIATIAMGNTYYLNGTKVTIYDRAMKMSEATELADKTLMKFSDFVDSKITAKVTQNQFNALVSMCYNIGMEAFSHSTALKEVNKDPNSSKVIVGIMLWTKNKELVSRRLSEVEQYKSKL